ncbi:MAG: PfkB family carbohydrate kinase [Granulosicoccus sp.]
MTRNIARERKQDRRILVCGLISADIIFNLPEIPVEAEKYRADDVRFSLGGGGAIAAVALQKLGAQAHLVGRLGDDRFSGLIREEFISHDIDSTSVIQIRNCKSPLSSIFIDANGERQIINYRSLRDRQSDTKESLNLDFLSAHRSLDAVLVDTRWEEAALHVLQSAREQLIPAVIDAEAPVCHEAMTLATHIAFSRQGLRDYANTQDLAKGLRDASAQFGNWVCVTDGEAGVSYLNEDAVVNVPAFPVVAIDTLGAGDVWHAAFTLQLAEGVTEHGAIVFANAAASLKCASAQGIDGVPDYASVVSLVEQNRNVPLN